MSINNEKEAIEKFITELKEFLTNDDPESAVLLFKSNIHEQIIEQSSWDVVPIVSNYFTSFNANNKKKLFECCETILNIIAEKCNPSETVLQFLEQIESLENDTKFCTMLKPVGISFNKLNDKSKAIEWCVGTIQSYIQALPIPSYDKSDSNKNKNIEETSAISHRIINLYTYIVSFLQSLIQELSLTDITKQDIIFKEYVLGLLIYLLGRPFCYLYEDVTVSRIRDQILKLIFHLAKDVLYPLNFVNDRSILENDCIMINKDSDEKPISGQLEKCEILELQEIVPTLAYANFYFYVITNEALWIKLPQVYHPHYIFQAGITLINCLLKEQDIGLISKGLIFMELLVKRVEKMSIGPDKLELKIYVMLLHTIINVMIYCESDSERKKALSVFHEYIINIFNMEARYFVILYLYNTCYHSGVLSLVTGLVKTSIIESLEMTPRCTYFFGSNLESLLKGACNLPYGSATDLVEISDEIITTLNLLRFLLIRDRSNETGIWSIVNMLEENYLKPLRQGIDLCKAHWKTKIKDLEEAKTKNKSHISNETEADKKVMLSVGNKKLPAMPIAQKLKFSHQVLCGLDVMERLRSLLISRVLVRYQSNDNIHQEEQHESSNEETEEEYEKKTKRKILIASMNFVPELGWSRQAISAGAESIGYPGIIHGMFPNGGAELVAHFYSSCNNELNKILKEKYEKIQADPAKKVQDTGKQICYAIETRLRMIIPYKKNWPQAIALMTLPPNVPTVLANLVTLVDDICYYTGDRSIDINWYTKRVVLAGIYKTTELYMLQDNSEDNEETWKFLKRRIEDVDQLHRIISVTSDLQQPEQALKQAKEIASATIITARNILGWNWYR
ncbi:hypothetical protein HZH68_006767 [Vespula germanica]|uniref:Ubiquinone biosynthesis protein n=1 Tax=Vespula germanica TaxID=30212 RepID=A0A834KC38_VESGE|nr:hypothetical protein HZH68_006767 [Vespula germanica]